MMEVKINTKEKFTVLTPITPHITDTLAESINLSCLNYLNATIKNVVLNLQATTAIDQEAAKSIVLMYFAKFFCQRSWRNAIANFPTCDVK